MKHVSKYIFSLLITLIFTSKTFATGAGAQLGAIPGLFINEEKAQMECFTGNITGTIRMSSLPLVAGAGFEGGKLFSDFNYGFSMFADYWVIDTQIKNTISFYSGFGASGKVLTTDFKDWSLSAGARFFAGLNYTLWDGYLELYAQQNIVPSYVFTLKDVNKGSFMLCFPFEAGIRMHF